MNSTEHDDRTIPVEDLTDAELDAELRRTRFRLAACWLEIRRLVNASAAVAALYVLAARFATVGDTVGLAA